MPLGAARFGLLGGVADLGKLELIETVSISTSVANVDFESLGSYNVHLATFTNWHNATDQQLGIRFAESGTYETSAVYQTAYQRGAADANFGEARSTGINMITMHSAAGGTGSAREVNNGYVYFYNLVDSSKYSFVTYQTSILDSGGDASFSFGSGVLPQASAVDKIRFLGFSGTNLDSGEFSLYGIAES